MIKYKFLITEVKWGPVGLGGAIVNINNGELLLFSLHTVQIQMNLIIQDIYIIIIGNS